MEQKGTIQIVPNFTFNGLILFGLDMISAFDTKMKSSNGKHQLFVNSNGRRIEVPTFVRMDEVVVEKKIR